MLSSYFYVYMLSYSTPRYCIRYDLFNQLLKNRKFSMSTVSKGLPEKAKLLTSTPVTNPDKCKWIGLQELTYMDPNGIERKWDCAVRLTRNSSGVDGIGILTILKYNDGRPDELLLEKQFRPPTGGVCIEMPAGLIDKNEPIWTAALRELREETGYVGKVINEGPIIFNDPGFTNTNMSIVTVEVDMSLPEKQNPKANMEDNEFIECFKIPLSKFPEEIGKLYEQGYKLDARLQNIAFGISFARRYNL